MLCPLHYQIRGIVEYSTRQDYSSVNRVDEIHSTMGQLVCHTPWLPNSSGEFVQPSDLSLDDLPNDFTKDEQLALKLRMHKSFADITTHFVDRHGRELTEGQSEKLQAFYADPSLLDDVEIPSKTLRFAAPSAHYDDEPDFDYLESLDASFNREAKRTEGGADRNRYVSLRNPGRQLDKSKEELEAAIRDEPRKDNRINFQLSVKWEDKNTATRDFLRAEYDGKCQVCRFTFESWVVGEHYFEDVYVVSHTEARWVDRPGNVLCLCANHAAQFLYGTVEAKDIQEQIMSYNGDDSHSLHLELCCYPSQIHFTQRHIIELQAIVELHLEQ